MPLDNTSSWITALPEVTDHPAAAGGAPPAVPQYPRVPVHPAPDNPNALTDLSDEDYASFMAGKPLPAPHAGAGSPAGAGGTASADNNSWITSLPEVTDHPAAAPPTNQNGGVFANIGAGTNQAITGMLGAPVDLANAAMSGLDRLRMATGGIPSPFAESDAVPIGGSQWIKNQEAKIGISPDQVAATNQVDRLARAGGAGVAGMILPWAAARAAPAIMGALAPSAASAIPGAVTAAPKLAGIPGAMVESFGAGGAPTMAATGFAGGVAGQEAEDSVPDPWKPWANFAGNIVGGLPVIGARALLGKAADIAAPVARNATAPLTDAGQQRLAAERVIGAMSDPDAVRTTLANPAPDLVPGSSATPYQLTADRGLGTLERGVSRNARYAPGFDQLRGEQNAARIAAIEGANPPQSWVLRTDSGDVPVTPSGHEFTTSNGQVYSEITTSDGRVGMIPKDNLVQVGDVSSIVPWFRSQLAAADAEDEAAISGNRNTARSAVDAIGTPTTPHTAGAAVRQGVEATAAPALAQSDAEIAAAQRDAEAALARQGGDQGTTLQDHGARIRGGIEAERAPVKTAGKRLLDAVDPDRNLVVGGLDSVADTAALLKGDRSPRGGWKVDNADHLSDIAADGDDDLAPAERAVLNRVSQLGDAETFQNLRRQTRRIATAQRAFARDPALGRESLPYARMTALRGAIEDALARTVGEKAESDAAAVSAGKMKPEDSIQGRLFGPEGLASGRRLPIPPVAGPDLFGTSSPEPISRTQEPLIRNDARQITMPGLDPSARQARAARDAAGPRGDQKPADQGLFGRKEAVQPELEGERGKPRAPNVPPSGAQREGLQPGFDRKTIAAPHPESNGPDLSHLTPIQRDIVRGTDLHGYDPETAAGIRTRLLSHLPTTDPQAALRTANFEKFLRDNGIAHTVENSQSISGQFGPSASRYYKLSNGATIRLSDHSYPSSATIDLRYGEPQGAAFDRVLRAANLPPISRWAPNTHASRTFTDTLPQVQGQGHEAAASHVFDLGRTTGHEHIAVVDNATGQVVHAGTESLPAQVGFSHANTAGAATDAFTIHHNHPNSTALSREDVSMLANPGISHVVAHGHDGLTTTASLSPRMAALRSPAEIGENALGITLAYKKAQRIAQDILLPLRDAGRITATQASQAYNDVANRLLHASGWLNYTSTLDLGADVRAAINAELKKPGYAPDALDDRYTVAVRPEGRIASLPQKHDDGAGQGLARGQGSDSGSAGVSDARGQNPTDAPRGLREDSGDNDAHTANGRTSVYTPAGRKIPVQYRVVETDSLTPSHTDDLKVNPAYPPELQPRDRTRAASQEQVQKIAGNLNPERLGPSPSTMEGAPVVSNGVVVSGNGRTLALRHVYANNPESAQRYRAYLESLGYDTKGIEKPILVGDMGPAPHGDLVRIAQESNTSPGLAMGAAERAGVDAGRMSDDLLGKWKPGDVDSGVNSDFVRSFIEHVPDASERGGFYTPDGNLSLEGIQRIRNALLQRAYGDPKLVSALSEVGDESIRGFGNALSDAAGDMARLKADIAAGRVDPGTDLSPHLLDAARIVSQARRRGISLQKMAAQTDMLAGRIDPLTMSVLRAAYGPNLTGRISRAKMSELLAYYADQASKATTGPSLFGDIKPPTAAEIFQRGISRAGSEPTLRATDSAGRAGSTESYGAGAGQVGDQGRRSGNGAGGPGTTTSRGPEGTTSQVVNFGSHGLPGAQQQPFPGIQPRLIPNATPANVAALKAANAGYANYKQRFRTGAVGDVLATDSRTQNGYRMGDSGVPRAVFNGGAKGAEAADSLIHAAGSSEAALNILGDYPAYSLRAAAEEMGTLSVPKYQKWLTDNKAAMDKFPELKAQFDTAAKARAVLDDLKAQRAALDDAYPIKPGWGDAEIMQRFVVPGPKGYEAAQQLLDATRGAPQAQEATKDYLAWSLRDAAEVRSGSNAGTLDPGAYSRWMKRYDGFLSHPAMADVRSRFESAAAAQQTLDESIAAHLERKGAYEDSVAKHFLGDADPVTSIGHILKSGTPGAQMADLARLTSADPIARESIQRAVVKYIQRELKSNNPVGSDLDQTYLKSNALQEFIRQHVSGDGEQALRHIMTPEQLDALNSVALDMRRSNLSLTANKAPAGSDTALNRSAMGAATHGAPSTAAMLAAIEASGEVAGHVAGGLLGPLGHLVGKVGGIVGVPYLQKARAVGFSRVDDLVAEAVLHPEKMSALFDKLPTPETAPSRLAVLNAQVRALAASSAMRDDTDQKKEAAGR